MRQHDARGRERRRAGYTPSFLETHPVMITEAMATPDPAPRASISTERLEVWYKAVPIDTQLGSVYSGAVGSVTCDNQSNA